MVNGRGMIENSSAMCRDLQRYAGICWDMEVPGSECQVQGIARFRKVRCREVRCRELSSLGKSGLRIVSCRELCREVRFRESQD